MLDIKLLRMLLAGILLALLATTSDELAKIDLLLSCTALYCTVLNSVKTDTGKVNLMILYFRDFEC